MIVTCEKCAARYKLDDAKVSGRGAKITCPRCRHVFVVFREEDRGAPAKGPASTLLPEDGPVTPAGAVTPPAVTQRPSTSGSRPQAPSPVYTPPAPPPPPAPRRDVHTLDFRKVGIASWKVRVKIGLIYDFSDYKTLRKYIQDGRVTASDLLSYDGKQWVPIGDIPDLEMYFIEVYEAAEKKKERDEGRVTGSDNPFEDESPTAVVGMSDLAASSLAGNLASQPPPPSIPPSRSATPTIPPVSAPLGGSRSPTPTIPPTLEPGRAAGRPSRSQPTIPPTPAAQLERAAAQERQGGGLGVGGAVVLLLALGALGAWAWINFFKDPPPPPPTPQAEAPEATTPPPDPEAIREKVREELQRELESTEPRDPIVVDEPKLIPVRPKDLGSQGTSARATTPSSTAQPSGAGTITTAPASAKDHAQVGDDAWRNGDYKTAAAAYGQAASLEPASALYQGKLGKALYRTGDLGGASAALLRANKGGWAESSKWLGHIARDQGDDPGAIGHYNDYLKTSPSDAAEIQREIDKLTGS